MATNPGRAGKYVKQTEGYRAFLPAMLPPKPPVRIRDLTLRLLSDADRALGRLDGVTSVLPNADLFVAMYVRHEAVLSSQIEGTQSTLEDVLEFEADLRKGEGMKDVEEVVNYVGAMNHGLQRLASLPLSLRLIREIHEKLLHGGRGAERCPGEFRRSQNWIGPAGSTLNQATFVPPPPHEMKTALENLETFLHDRTSLPALIQCAIAHAQFETIHPFLDGNGRVGRLLITFLLCEREILRKPLLYLSYYLKAHRSEYYDRLTAIRNSGDWEGWILFFLRGVFEVSQGATNTAREILDLREGHRNLIGESSRKASTLRLLDILYQSPIISAGMAARLLDCTKVTAANAIADLQNVGVVREITGGLRNRKYRYESYLALFDRQVAQQAADDVILKSDIH